MEWICRECGTGVTADDPVLIMTIGWTELGGATGVCPICSEHEKNSLHRSSGLLARSRACVEASRRQIAVSRTMIRKTRGG